MGIINEYHEPTTFNGVERPNLDSKIVPTTWREMGFGFVGKFDNLSLKYQVYLVNGFNGYSGSQKLRGKDGLRKGRQKAAESFITTPNLSGKIDYYGLNGLKIGIAGYFGNTQTTAYEGLNKDDNNLVASADSTKVGVTMVGFDARYNYNGFQAKGQLIYSSISNTDQYNNYGSGADLGSEMLGYYAEIGYDLLRLFKKNTDKGLTVFARYENYDTHYGVYSEAIKNDAFNRTDITVGLGFKMGNGAVLKGDYQQFTTASQGDVAKNQINFGVGIWF